MGDIQFNCPKCGHSLIVDAAGAGMSVPCPECNEPLIIPGPDEQAAAQADKVNAGVDTTSTAKARPNEEPLGRSQTGGQATKLRSVMSVVARVLRVLFSWLAKLICLIGWLVIAAFQLFLVAPLLRARLLGQYMKIGAQAYRNKIDIEKGAAIRNKIIAVDHEAEVAGSLPIRKQKLISRLGLIMARMMGRIKKRRLLAMLGKVLAGGGAVNDELSHVIQHTRGIIETIGRIKARRPVRPDIGNITIGVVVILVIARSCFSWANFAKEVNVTGGVQLVTGLSEEPQKQKGSSLGSADAWEGGKTGAERMLQSAAQIKQTFTSFPDGYYDILTGDMIEWGSKPERVQQVFGPMRIDTGGAYITEQNPNASAYYQQYANAKLTERVFYFDSDGLFQVVTAYSGQYFSADEMIEKLAAKYGSDYEQYEYSVASDGPQKHRGYDWVLKKSAKGIAVQQVSLGVSAVFGRPRSYYVQYFDMRSFSRGRRL